MSRYNSKSSNPFGEEEEDDFVQVPSHGQTGSPFDDKRQQLSRMVNESEDRQLESTQRAIASLYESEAMGNVTAEELLRQREVIQNIEKKTDDINTTLTTSQKHINNIKSVFGGIKNWWGGKKDAAPGPAEQKPSSLDSIVKRNQDVAGTSGSGTSGRGWGEEKSPGWGESGSDGDLDSRFLARSPQYGAGSGASGGGRSAGLQYVQPITRSAREEDLDKNLGVMSDGLGRLKMLAQGLGDEIEQQNEMLDRVDPKVNRANDLLEIQNHQMNRILKR
ncbi:synaptosomal-associated protein 29-like [Littorina saxatilis]|uniref:t-SNARE coiled-coil homology domain-containing protein n=1 Tax=Littorina saxatilis TaxID=31220 RepID=A0AAN9AIY8_9CAEN